MNIATRSASVPPRSRLRATPLDRQALEDVVWETLLNALLALEAMRRPRLSGRAGAEAVERARRELSELLDQQLFTILLRDGTSLLERRRVFSEVKADLLAAGAIALQLPSPLCDELSTLIDRAASPAWQQLEIEQDRDEKALADFRHEAFVEDVLPGVEWGFTESAGPRLHLQWLGSPHRVWLEHEGQRGFEPDAPFDACALSLLEYPLGKPGARARVEQAWVRWMLLHGWLEVEWECERSLVLHAYPNLPGAFQRRVSLQGVEPTHRPLCPQDVQLSEESSALVLWGELYFPLSELLWAPEVSDSRLRVSPAPAPLLGPRLEADARARFKESIEHGLGQALLVHYRGALAEKNGHAASDADGDERGRLETSFSLPDRDELKQQHAQDCRRAYAEAVLAFTRKDAAFRRGATAHLLRDLGVSRLPRPLDPGDTADFWNQIDDALEEEWSELGFAVEERLKADWRRRPQFPLRDVPWGYSWLWAVERRGPQRMHLRSSPSLHRVWLEKDGQRAFEPEGRIDEAILGPLRRAVERHRAFYDARWSAWMILRGWLELEWVSETELALRAYPNTRRAVTHRVEVRQYLPGARPVQQADLRLDIGTASVEVRGQGNISLPAILWRAGR